MVVPAPAPAALAREEDDDDERMTNWLLAMFEDGQRRVRGAFCIRVVCCCCIFMLSQPNPVPSMVELIHVSVWTCRLV